MKCIKAPKNPSNFSSANHFVTNKSQAFIYVVQRRGKINIEIAACFLFPRNLQGNDERAREILNNIKN